MEVNTSIAESIHATDQYAQYDAACKRVLAEKIVLAWIMKSCLKEYQDCCVEEIAEKYIEGTPQVGKVPGPPDETNAPRIRGISSQDTSLTESSSTYDIRFLAFAPDAEGPIQMIVNLEAQNEADPGYPLIKRGIFYCGRMLTAQYGTEFTHSQYQKIKKVVSIWVCMAPPKKWKNSITRYHLTEENLVGSVREKLENYDLIDVVMLCLGGEDQENYSGVLKMLDVLLSPKTGEMKKRQILGDEFDIPMTETLEREVHLMCNLSQGVKELGRTEGRTEGIIESIRSLMANTGWTLERAMEALGIPEADRLKYAGLLRKQ